MISKANRAVESLKTESRETPIKLARTLHCHVGSSEPLKPFLMWCRSSREDTTSATKTSTVEG